MSKKQKQPHKHEWKAVRFEPLHIEAMEVFGNNIPEQNGSKVYFECVCGERNIKQSSYTVSDARWAFGADAKVPDVFDAAFTEE